MKRFYPLCWLAVVLGLFGTQCLDSISDDCKKTLTCDDQPPPHLDDNCIWRNADESVWEGGPHYDTATKRWLWPDGTESETQNFTCTPIGGAADAGADASTGQDCRRPETPCDLPRVCDQVTGLCFECQSNSDCSGNVPVGDAGAANVCDLVRHECVQCLESTNCSGDTPVCKTDAADSDRNQCVECVNDTQCGGTTPVCDETTNECTARCTTPQECSGEKPVCNVTKQLCVECLDEGTCKSPSATQCNTTSNECVECTDDAPCSANGEVCDLTSNNCVQCRENVQCANAAGKFCETETNLCVECLNDQQCTGVANSRCNTVTHQCVGCTSDTQCEGLAPFCNEALGGLCVQCLEDTNCGVGFNRTCETTTGQCVECLNNAQCSNPDAARCVVAPELGETLFTCAGCKTNPECSGKSDGGLCRAADGLCVDCLEPGDCSGNAALSKCGVSGTCSICTVDEDCGAVTGKGACKTDVGCVECVNDTQCDGNADGPHCKLTNNGASQGTAAVNTCVQCTSNADCTGAGAALCQNNACVPCVGDADCAHLDTNGAAAGGTLGVCDTGTCVECTGPKRAACGTNVCNSLTKVCSTQAAGSADLCETCVSDAACASTARCVTQTFGGASVGFFCFPLATGAAPGTCGGRFYLDSTIIPTIDAEQPTPTVCELRETTCPALLAYTRADPCDTSADCGIASVADGICDAVLDVCTVPCGGGSDCLSACRDDLSCEP
jgi:hypothetical protein